VELLLLNKVYVLARADGDGRRGSGRTLQAGAGALEPERVCLFCGSPLEET
jgi:hypothetical protein